MTTTTDELRRKLAELHVEYETIDGPDICFTEWSTHNGAFVFTARESSRSYGDNMLRVETCGIPKSCIIATPEQAIAATLGRGECHITDNGPWGYPYVCSACGASFDPDINNGEFNYCPNCGRKVVGE